MKLLMLLTFFTLTLSQVHAYEDARTKEILKDCAEKTGVVYGGKNKIQDINKFHKCAFDNGVKRITNGPQPYDEHKEEIRDCYRKADIKLSAFSKRPKSHSEYQRVKFEECLEAKGIPSPYKRHHP